MVSTELNNQYRNVLSWLRGGDTTPNPRMEDMFIDVMTSLVRNRMELEEQKQREEEACRRAERRTYSPASKLSLRSLINECIENGEIEGTTYEELMGINKREEKSAPVSEEVKTCEETPTGANALDSEAVGKALCHISRMDRRTLNMSQVQTIMYISYGVWLANTGNRLTEEHPQMWQFGPVFPRAYNRMRKNPSDGQQEYDAITSEHPEVIDFLKSQYQRFGFTTASTITAPHLAAGTPWAETRKKSPDKWGIQMDDNEISSWFSAHMS